MCLQVNGFRMHLSRAPIAHLVDRGPVISELLSRGSQIRVLPGAPILSDFLGNRSVHSPSGSVANHQKPSEYAWVDWPWATAWVMLRVLPRREEGAIFESPPLMREP